VPETVAITASYAFFDLEEAKLKHLQTALTAFGKTRGMRGLVLVATEGINSTVSGTSEVIAEWKKHLTEQFGAIVFKDSSASRQVFRRFSVKIKPEIVGLKQQGIKPAGKHKHLSPAEWQQMLEKEDVVLIDTRNDYEVAIGKFAGAIDPQIKSFQEFPEYVKQSALPKDKKSDDVLHGRHSLREGFTGNGEAGVRECVSVRRRNFGLSTSVSAQGLSGRMLRIRPPCSGQPGTSAIGALRPVPTLRQPGG
jgi:predicted sulfurtransferase